MREYATVREAHDDAMARMDDALETDRPTESAHRACVDALLSEAQAVRLAFERETSAQTRYVLLRSLSNIARTLADHVAAEVRA